MDRKKYPFFAFFPFWNPWQERKRSLSVIGRNESKTFGRDSSARGLRYVSDMEITRMASHGQSALFPLHCTLDSLKSNPIPSWPLSAFRLSRSQQAWPDLAPYLAARQCEETNTSGRSNRLQGSMTPVPFIPRSGEGIFRGYINIKHVLV